MDFIHKFQGPAEHLLDMVFHGWAQNTLFAMAIGIAVVFIMFAAFATRRRIDGTRTAFSSLLLFVCIIVALASVGTVLLTIAAQLQECRATTALVAYQFGDDSPASQGVTISQCHSHPVGIPDWLPWGAVTIK